MTAGPGRPEGGLTPASILDAAVGLIDLEGAAALTMRRLGAALGVEAMAVYRYFPSRMALLDAVVARVVGEVESDPASQLRPDDDWTDYLDRLAHGMRRMALAHPRVFPLIATHPVEAPWIRPPIRSLDWVDSFLEGLQAHHFPPPAAVTVYKLFTTFLLGNLLLEVSALGLDHRPAATAPPPAPDSDQRAAAARRRDDARAAEEATGDPRINAAAILEGATARPATVAEEPAMASDAADLAGVEPAGDASAGTGVGSPTGAGDAPGPGPGAGAAPADAVEADADVPVIAAVVSTTGLSLDGHPHLVAFAGLLAMDTAGTDFDRQLGWLLADVAQLRRG